jgi:glycosyltransferase involved in cell wall biosynthesis
MRILHVVTGLNTGGAELLLCDLSERLEMAGFEQRVVSLLPEGPLSARIRRNGLTCLHLGLRRGRLDFSGVKALASEIRGYAPTVIHSWMYHACIYATVSSAVAAQKTALLWSIHHANLRISANTPSTLLAATACGLLSWRKDVHITYCAESSRIAHESRGYCGKRGIFIANGYAGQKFRRCPDAGRRVREHFNVPGGKIVIGMVARYDPIKDHASFLQAAGAARRGDERLFFLLFGDGIDQSNTALMELVERNGLNGSIILGGRSDDVAASYSAMDLLVSSSRGEAFSNVICEGMLCELPCIVTNVGDSAAIAGDTGYIVAPSRPEELGKAMLTAAQLPAAVRERLGAAARERIVTKYPEESFTNRYIDAYRALSDGRCLS